MFLELYAIPISIVYMNLIFHTFIDSMNFLYISKKFKK